MISPLRLPVRFISVKTAAAFADPRKNPVGMLQKMPVAAHHPAIPMVNPAKASHGLEISPAASRPPPPPRKPPMRCLPRSCTRPEYVALSNSARGPPAKGATARTTGVQGQRGTVSVDHGG